MSKVPRFEPSTETTELPKPGAFETNTLDFKGRLSRREGDEGSIDHSEIAKDVAAFANLILGVSFSSGSTRTRGEACLARSSP